MEGGEPRDSRLPGTHSNGGTGRAGYTPNSCTDSPWACNSQQCVIGYCREIICPGDGRERASIPPERLQPSLEIWMAV